MDPSSANKAVVKEHWEKETCGVRYATDAADRRRFFAEIEETRYRIEPHIPRLARFETARGKKVLEIGVGAGTDFVQWVRNGARAVGIDLTLAGAKLTRERLGLEGKTADVLVADAENLPFRSEAFDVVYSHGVLMCSPDTPRAFDEAARVLRSGGRGVFMIYHLYSWTTLLLWMRFGLARGRPFESPRRLVEENLESPGTKVYSRSEARSLMPRFKDVSVQTILGVADLLTLKPSQKFEGPLSSVALRLYPRRIVRLLGHQFGFNMWMEGRKE